MTARFNINVAPKATWPVSTWEFHEAVRRANDVMRQPRGNRSRQMRAIAVDYGISERTLYRWRTYSVHEVRVGRYEALFVCGTGTPAQVTRWERMA